MILPIDHQLGTLRCILRYPVLKDSAPLLSVFESDDFPRYVPLGQLNSIEQVNRWIQDIHKRWAAGRGYTWTAVSKSNEKVIGQVSLVMLKIASIWSLAFWTHPDYWGQGYATEIASCAVEFAFRELCAQKVWAAAAKWNEGSLRVLQKLGMNYLGENEAGYRIDDKPIPTKEFALERVHFDRLKR